MLVQPVIDNDGDISRTRPRENFSSLFKSQCQRWPDTARTLSIQVNSLTSLQPEPYQERV
jgi:hypothetical protein